MQTIQVEMERRKVTKRMTVFDDPRFSKEGRETPEVGSVYIRSDLLNGTMRVRVTVEAID